MSCRFVGLLLVLLLLGCSAPLEESRILTLATSTSTRDSGLLDVLLPTFEQRTGIKVKVIAVGSGQALELGRRGDVDVIISHAPDVELLFVAQGHAYQRHPFMYNDFLLVGPERDPAGVHGQSSITEALRQLARRQARFISRGDDSGTHMKELALWQEADVTERGEWYVEAGTGMAETLQMASEKAAYSLTDRATYLAQRHQLQLVILTERDPLLNNLYSVIIVNPAKHPGVNRVAAQQFANFLLSKEGQETIASFGEQQYEQPLFFPISAQHADPSPASPSRG